MAKVFITGGSSYLGIKLIQHFSDFQFTALVHKKLIKYKNVKLLKIDTPEDIMKNFKDEKYDYVFHFATQKYMENDLDKIKSYIDTNINLGRLLLDASKSINLKLFVSSGTLWQSVLKEKTNLYTITKTQFEEYLYYYSKFVNFRTLSLRLGDLYGPDDFRNKLIPYIKSNENNSHINFISNGSDLISPVNIDDVIDAVKFSINNKKSNFEALHLASNPMTIKIFVEKYKVIRNKNFDTIYGNSKNNFYSINDFNNSVNNLWENKITLENGLINI